VGSSGFFRQGQRRTRRAGNCVGFAIERRDRPPDFHSRANSRPVPSTPVLSALQPIFVRAPLSQRSRGCQRQRDCRQAARYRHSPSTIRRGSTRAWPLVRLDRIPSASLILPAQLSTSTYPCRRPTAPEAPEGIDRLCGRMRTSCLGGDLQGTRANPGHRIVLRNEHATSGTFPRSRPPVELAIVAAETTPYKLDLSSSAVIQSAFHGIRLNHDVGSLLPGNPPACCFRATRAMTRKRSGVGAGPSLHGPGALSLALCLQRVQAMNEGTRPARTKRESSTRLNQ